MKQLLQNVSSGAIRVEDVPAPARDERSLLVATRYSVISAGTERAVMELGKASLIGKARERPDLVRKVIESARTEGLATTYAKVRGRLGEPNALGYSLSGIVLEACEDAPAAPGELVACAGAGIASHAEIVAVPKNLCARVPEGVAAEDAAYGTVATIALHGVRLAEAGLGSIVAVVGLGLVGQLTLEVVRAAGAVALGVDPDPERVELARTAGFFAATEPAELEAECLRRTSGRGADAVLVTAASSSSAPLATGCAVARERAVICIVGDVEIASPRAPLFSKELRLVVSRSYGPGRYDRSYEHGGHDYPASYVRWTEGRNLNEVLRLMSTGQLRPSRVTTHTFDLADGDQAYATLESDQPSIGIVLRYPGLHDAGVRSVDLPSRRRRRASGERPRVGVIGAGTFARGVLMPALASGGEIVAIANATGVSAKAAGTRFGARTATTDVEEVIGSTEIDAVVIATRHDTHAGYARRALEAGKHVFVEKPMGMSADEVAAVEAAAAGSEGVFMVGFNRRFAPLATRLRDGLAGAGPLVISCRVNAGRLPRDHWTHDAEIGGGRIIGEVCHFVDFVTWLAGSWPTEVHACGVGGGSEPREDNLATTLRFGDGSIAQIVYAAFGDPSLPKERVEVLGERGAGVLVDFREVTLHTAGRESSHKGKRDKGHASEIETFLAACSTGEQPWPVADMAAVSRTTLQIHEAVVAGGG